MKFPTCSKSQMWAQHIQAQLQSDISQKAYCEAHVLKPHQFWYWKRKLSSEQSSLPSAKITRHPAFIPVTVASSQRPADLTLHFSDGLQLSGITEQTLPLVQTLVSALR
jgi:transposase-like protein